jgi:FtsP/CotA-like multicopper oxidase with cupredoxin domain
MFTSSRGNAGQYHLHDETERNLLPQGIFDVPLTISDAMFAANGFLGYNDNTHSGLWGDIIPVNGAPWPVMKVQRRIYRFRILNASISRSYNFRLSTGDPVTMAATDGGLPSPTNWDPRTPSTSAKARPCACSCSSDRTGAGT